jgi:hypothetical protein
VRYIRLIVCLMMAGSLLACQERIPTESRHTDVPAVTDAQLELLRGMRLYFGHQSVGYNIIQGVRDVYAAKQVREPSITETREPSAATGPGLYHAAIGMNGDPLGKIRDFESIMRSGMAAKMDVAFMKLCYVDVNAASDIVTIFAVYRDTMTRLAADFPTTSFFAMTVPLVTRDTGIRAIMKGILGRPSTSDADNLQREALNSLLRAEYSGRGNLIDLARFESTLPDARRTQFELGGKAAFSLAGVYSEDGGHLNHEGRMFIAEQFLASLGKALLGRTKNNRGA